MRSFLICFYMKIDRVVQPVYSVHKMCYPSVMFKSVDSCKLLRMVRLIHGLRE